MADDSHPLPLIRITPRAPFSLGLRELWASRELIFFLLARRIKGEHRQMALGPLWIVIGPVLSMVFFTVIFGKLAGLPSDDMPYPLFNFTGLLPWTFFATGAYASANSLLDNRDLIRKVYFPRLVLPVVGVFAALVDLAACSVVLLFLLVWYGLGSTSLSALAALPLFLTLAAATGLSVGLWLGAWIVHYRDMAKVLGYLLSGWMFLSPVVYASSMIPEGWRTIYQLNPMTTVVEGFRWTILGSSPPDPQSALLSALIVAVFLLGGVAYFRVSERGIVDVA